MHSFSRTILRGGLVLSLITPVLSQDVATLAQKVWRQAQPIPIVLEYGSGKATLTGKPERLEVEYNEQKISDKDAQRLRESGYRVDQTTDKRYTSLWDECADGFVEDDSIAALFLLNGGTNRVVLHPQYINELTKEEKEKILHEYSSILSSVR